MEAFDALKNPIVLNKRYGYSKSQNGITRVIFGTVIKIDNGKVTLDKIEENTYVFISNSSFNPDETEYPKNKRTLSSVQLFPV